MANLNADIRTVQSPVNQYGLDDSTFWLAATCPHCGPSSFLMVAATVSSGSPQKPNGHVQYLRCVACRRGAVMNNGVLSPGTTPLPAVDGCPDDVDVAWTEVRSDLSAGAATSAVMMCRKLLFHIAVEQGLAPENDKGRAPTFEQCLAQLREKGLLTPPLEPWVQHIKDVGNKANHDLSVITPEDALRVATFTRQLLVTTYEMPFRMREALGEPEEPLDGATTISV
ncbi:DUF4145 domain-containing protein [Cellulomonas uda]|uniref:DUF4145 domain-containing protein n=1 Tax=Cellulomonas uda TaxID=1714 RepID=A0A4Y3K820_CELUD|nr:DUF4145 domain-containing protein [Cellulomonas uda]NII67414.1 hypothetical protein [Cellulomonas uda]GEA79866.1 hypothetical protein CUD01_03100 [Cellulomonas uda]